VPSADANLRLHGATSNNVTNTWRWSKAQRKRLRAGSPCRVDPDTPDPNGQRLDYIFVSTGSTSTSSPLDPDPVPGPDHHHGPVSGWVIKSASVTMTARHPDLNVSLSDHYAVQATLVRHSSSATATNNAGTAFSNSSSNLLLRGATPSHDSLSRPLTASTTAFQTGAFLAAPDSPTSSKGHRHGQGDARGRVNCAADDDDDDDDDGDNSRRPCHPANFDTQLRYHHVSPDSLPIPLYDEVLAMIHTYAAREQKERRWRGIHFYVSIAVWVACLIAVWFSPANYVSFILVLVASLDLVAGTINGLLALLFFSSEIRALKEFEWEIRNAKAVASGDLVALADGHSPNGKVQG
jgi:sphingomyelin phosphodiesterase 2